MKTQRSLWAAAILLLGMATVTGASLAAPEAITIERWVLGASGHGEGVDLSLDGTVGQPFAGLSGGGTMSLSSGFWFPILSGFEVYLPIVYRTVP